MSRFIELHINEDKYPPVIVNADRIVYVEEVPRNGGCYVRIGMKEDGGFKGYYVLESYSFFKRELL